MGVMLTVCDQSFFFHVLGGLQIRHSLESDEGKYECVAENSVGVVFSYGANLYVRGQFHRMVLYLAQGFTYCMAGY